MGALKNRALEADFAFVEALEEELDSQQQDRDERLSRISAIRGRWGRAFYSRGYSASVTFTMSEVEDLLTELETLRRERDEETFTHG